MQKSNLYTRTGDTGTTSLVGGTRAPKDDLRLQAYGTVDEFSAHLGLLLAYPHNETAIAAILRGILHRLFSIGAYLATPTTDGQTPAPQGLTDADCREIEQAIDSLDAALPPIHAFILPTGTPQAARAHIARTVCRRAERHIVTLARHTYVHPLILTYFNRLSDLLFILARHYNHTAGQEETTWQQQ